MDETTSWPLHLEFDRGTLLLRGHFPLELAGGRPLIPGLLWDPRVAALRAPAYRYAELCQALRASSVTFSDRVGAPLLADLGSSPAAPVTRGAAVANREQAAGQAVANATAVTDDDGRAAGQAAVEATAVAATEGRTDEPEELGDDEWRARREVSKLALHIDDVRRVEREVAALAQPEESGGPTADHEAPPMYGAGATTAARRVAVTAPPLRPYQTDALAAWRLAGARGIVALPTGSGKTHVALAAMAALGTPTLILVPTRVLLGQWVARLQEIYRGPLGIYGDGSRSLAPVTVSTFESAYRHLERIGHRFGLLVVDEAHHFGGGQRAEALEMCTAPARLGLTATPPEAPEAAARLEDLIGPLVCSYSIARLAAHLAPFDCIRLPVSLSATERACYQRGQERFQEAFRRFRREQPRGSWQEFVVAAAASSEGRAALAGYHESRRVVSLAGAKLRLAEHLLERHREDRVLLFTAENRAAYALSRRLLLPAITCDIGRAERGAILERLRRGELRALVSARVLNEGIDLPEARVGIIVGGALGGREHVQRVGRLLRAQPGKRAVIYEVIARDTFELAHARRRQRYLVA